MRRIGKIKWAKRAMTDMKPVSHLKQINERATLSKEDATNPERELGVRCVQ